MCNRYVLASSVRAIEKELLADFNAPFSPFYNAHPGEYYPVVLSEDAKKIQFLRWGLIPYWSKWGNINYNYNAFVSDLVKHFAYRLPIRKKRCLVPANCYYCWIRASTGKTPHVVYIKDQRIFTMAGVYDSWRDKNSNRLIFSFSIIAGYSNKRIAKFSPVMPVIIPPSRREKYLRESIQLQEVMRMLKPLESDQFNLYPVSKKICNLTINSKEQVMPVGERLYREFTYQPKVYQDY